MNVSGTQTLSAPVAPASNLDAIRQAITLVRVNARSEPSAVVLNPTDAQNIDLLKVNSEANNFVGPGPYGVGAARLWNVPVIETSALSAGTALVGDFSKAVLFDRLSLSITLGTINDQFIRYMVTVLGEITGGLRCVRPTAFESDARLVVEALSAERRGGRALTPSRARLRSSRRLWSRDGRHHGPVCKRPSCAVCARTRRQRASASRVCPLLATVVSLSRRRRSKISL